MMPNTSMNAMVGRPDPKAPPMVELTLIDDGDPHRFWFLPDSARSFAEDLVRYADEADQLRLRDRPPRRPLDARFNREGVPDGTYSRKLT
jgi:hypothetical protein